MEGFQCGSHPLSIARTSGKNLVQGRKATFKGQSTAYAKFGQAPKIAAKYVPTWSRDATPTLTHTVISSDRAEMARACVVRISTLRHASRDGHGRGGLAISRLNHDNRVTVA